MCPFQEGQQRAHRAEQTHHQAVLESLARPWSSVPVHLQRAQVGHMEFQCTLAPRSSAFLMSRGGKAAGSD